MSATAEKTTPAPKPAAKPTPAKAAEKRDYVVLRQIQSNGKNDRWEHVGVASGATDTEAIKEATASATGADRTGTFVAVPSRSFRPKTRKIETVEKDLWA